MIRHPGEDELALYSGDEIGLWSRLRVRRHVSRCSQCRQTVQAFNDARSDVRDLAAELPGNVSWSRLEQEMTGNIRVGLAAGECIAEFGKGPRAQHVRFRHPGLARNAATVLACATIIVLAALWIELPKSELDHLAGSLQRIRLNRIGSVMRGTPVVQEDAVIEASPFSIGIRENGGAMTLLHPRSVGVALSVNMQGSAGARYVDSDTGQVTTNRVYYAQ